MKKVHAATAWRTNAEMILDLHRLGIVRQSDVVLDPTYGDGLWWSEFLPDYLIAHDLFKLDGVDFTRLPEPDNYVDVVAFDPPYMAPGGRATSTLDTGFYDQYGNLTTPRTPAALQQLINAGFSEARRVVDVGGYVMVKCMNYVSSGKTWPGVFRTFEHGEWLGLRFVDEWVYVGTPGPQPKTRYKTVRGVKVLSVQKHAAHNSSSLLIWKKPRVRH